VIRVSPRARQHEDHAGDPLDGLVNLFDVGIVLAVGFLLAALASLNLTGALTQHGVRRTARDQITVGPSETTRAVPSSAPHVVGRGTPVGRVYRLPDGRLVVVVPTASSAPVPASPSPSSTP
jgi:hypothetical protein